MVLSLYYVARTGHLRDDGLLTYAAIRAEGGACYLGLAKRKDSAEWLPRGEDHSNDFNGGIQ